MHWLLASSLMTLTLLAWPTVQQGTANDGNDAEEDILICYTNEHPPPMNPLDRQGTEAERAVEAMLRAWGKNPDRLTHIVELLKGEGEHCKAEVKVTWYKAEYIHSDRRCYHEWTTCPSSWCSPSRQPKPRCSMPTCLKGNYT